MLWSYLYDIILALIMVCLTLRGKRTGLFASLIRLLGWVLALFLIVKFSEQLAAWIFTNLLRDRVIDAVSAALPQEILRSMNAGAVSAQEALESIQTVLDNLGGILGAQTVDLAATEEILQLMQTDGATLAQLITDTVLQPVLVPLVQALLSVLIFLVCVWIFKLIAAGFARHNEKTGTGINSILGAVVGFGEGLLISFLYAYVLKVLTNAVGNSLPCLSPAIWQHTLLVHLLVK